MNSETQPNQNQTPTTTDGISIRITKLESRFNTWRDNSRPELYRILADCMALVEEVEKDAVKEGELNNLLKKREIRITKNTDLILKVLKIVISTCSKRQSKYATVIRIARQSKQDAKSLKKWIEKKKGIEKIVTKKSETSDSGESYKNEGKLCIGQKNVADTISRPGSFPKEAQGLVVVVGRITATQQLEILDFYPNQGVLNTIYSSAGKPESERKPTGTDQATKAASSRIHNLDAMKKESENTEKEPATQGEA